MSDNKILFEGRIIRAGFQTISLPNGTTITLDRVWHPGGAAVIALDEQHNICMLRQFRFLADGWIWELPAGKLDGQESPQNAAERELMEECGLKAREWLSLGEVYSSPGVFDEVIHLYLAQGLSQHETAHEEEEWIEVHWLPFADVWQQVLAGQIEDGKTIAGICRAAGYLT